MSNLQESRIEPEAIVVVEDVVTEADVNDVDVRVIEELEAVVPEVSRARSTTPPPVFRLVSLICYVYYTYGI